VNDGNNSLEKSFSLTINVPLKITIEPPIPETGIKGLDCNFTLKPSGGSGEGYKFSIQGKLPTGLKLKTTKENDNTTYAIA
jgi:hypothetical protein